LPEGFDLNPQAGAFQRGPPQLVPCLMLLIAQFAPLFPQSAAFLDCEQRAAQ
jgi:hypothetical protein